ncbi:hypothetical protein HPP92_023528 [Vanilla planifolia]|uniref:Uncharacterized protein n=1 Tax=Vanilla planifolia TaxID=51239 RepID=A0A835UC37_VANPL|nr:hypothetical protein HPP92_023528 [Vanilla planifolia]
MVELEALFGQQDEMGNINMDQYTGSVLTAWCSCGIGSDLLSRAGRLAEVEDFIKRMPFPPDAIVKIYAELGKPWLEDGQKGYSPDTSSVLYDVTEVEKRLMPSHHKLASFDAAIAELIVVLDQYNWKCLYN